MVLRLLVQLSVLGGLLITMVPARGLAQATDAQVRQAGPPATQALLPARALPPRKPSLKGPVIVVATGGGLAVGSLVIGGLNEMGDHPPGYERPYNTFIAPPFMIAAAIGGATALVGVSWFIVRGKQRHEWDRSYEQGRGRMPLLSVIPQRGGAFAGLRFDL
jgi:hypothetical protein